MIIFKVFRSLANFDLQYALFNFVKSCLFQFIQNRIMRLFHQFGWLYWFGSSSNTVNESIHIIKQVKSYVSSHS